MMRLLFSQGILLRFILCPEVSSMRRCYVNKPVRHVPPPPFYPRQTSDKQSAAYLLQRGVTLRHRAKPARSLYRDPPRLASPSLPSPIRRKAVAFVHERVRV